MRIVYIVTTKLL